MCDKCGLVIEVTHGMEEELQQTDCYDCNGQFKKRLGPVAINWKTSFNNKARRKKYQIKDKDGNKIDTPGRMV
jgi:predicted nucleic acid-binding Zn ribbon protein